MGERKIVSGGEKDRQWGRKRSLEWRHGIDTSTIQYHTPFVTQDIVLSNPLIEASYKPASLNQMRLLYACLLQVKAKETLDSSVPFVITASGLADLLGNEKLNNYGHLKAAADDLLNMVVQVDKQPNGKPGDPDRRRFNVVDGCEYYDGEGRIELNFTRNAIPYISELSSFFTVIEARYLLPLKSSYSIRLYQIFLQTLMATDQSSIIKEYSVDEFRKVFGLVKKYRKTRDLMKWVIRPTLKEINEKTDIRVRYGQRTVKRKIVDMQFEIEHKQLPKAKLPKPMSFEEYMGKEAKPGESLEHASIRLKPLYDKYLKTFKAGRP